MIECISRIDLEDGMPVVHLAKGLGQVGYESYVKALGVEGAAMSSWDQLPEAVRKAWSTAASEVANTHVSIGHEITRFRAQHGLEKIEGPDLD